MKAGRTDDLPPGRAICVEFDGRRVAVFNVDGTYLAVEDECTHAGGPLSEGPVDGTEVVCPWHGATFDLKTGEARSAPAAGALRCYRVRVEDGAIHLEN